MSKLPSKTALPPAKAGKGSKVAEADPPADSEPAASAACGLRNGEGSFASGASSRKRRT